MRILKMIEKSRRKSRIKVISLPQTLYFFSLLSCSPSLWSSSISLCLSASDQLLGKGKGNGKGKGKGKGKGRR
jgi:hypothetical protein